MKYFITYIQGACSRRQLDAEKIKNYFEINGNTCVEEPIDAEYIFAVTCGLTSFNEDMALKKIKEWKKLNKEIIILGCLPAMNENKLNSVFNGITIKTYELYKIDDLFPNFKYKFKDIRDPNKILNNKEDTSKGYEMAFDSNGKYKKALVGFDPSLTTLRISEGCLGKCSYCNIRKAVGLLKSKSLEDIKKELILNEDKNNYLNIIASDTGAYGLDINSNFPSLIREILKFKNIKINFLQDVHPRWISLYGEEIIEIFKSNRILGLQTAIQSGSSRILKLMNRNSELEKYIRIIKELKKNNSLKIKTQIIIGFPTETIEDINNTINVLKECDFDEVDVFTYYELPNMYSFNIHPKVPPETIVLIKNILRKTFSNLRIL